MSNARITTSTLARPIPIPTWHGCGKRADRLRAAARLDTVFTRRDDITREKRIEVWISYRAADELMSEVLALWQQLAGDKASLKRFVKAKRLEYFGQICGIQLRKKW